LNKGLLKDLYDFVFMSLTLLFWVITITALSTVLAQCPSNVIIIGAGPAGLSAAKTLLDSNCQNFVILEARDRIGGRVATNRNLSIELGAGWIHGTNIGNPVVRIAEQNNIATVFVGGDSSYIGGDHAIRLFGSDGQPLSLELKERSFQHMDVIWKSLTELFFFNRIRKNPEFDKSHKFYSDKPLLKALDGDILCNVLDYVINTRLPDISVEDLEIIHWHFEIIFGGDEGSDPCDLSFSSYGNYQQGYKGGDSVIIRGYDQIIEAMAKDFVDKIHLNEVVTSIDYSSTKILVNTAANTFVGSHVIITVPVGALKENLIDFIPDLPQSKKESIDRLKMGLLNRIALKFPHCFWDDSVYTFGFVSDIRGEWPMIVNQNHVEKGRNVLELMVGGEPAYITETLTDEMIIDSAMNVLNKIFNPQNTTILPRPESVRMFKVC
jgi:monoamine oxidase